MRALERASRALIEPEGTELAPGYRVIAHLARGRRLDVYDAWSVERDSRCVLKTLRPDRAHDRRARAALTREGRMLRRFTHPHLVRAYEVTGTLDGRRPVVVLETLGGETLSHLIDRLGDEGSRLGPGDVAVLGQQLASALAYLHRDGWLHLDLKPSNIIVVGGSAKLIDLSIARRGGRVRPGTGTIDYMSPEQARGGEVTTASDVWGLGAVLYAALTGEPPYGYLLPTTEEASAGESELTRSSATDESWTSTSAADATEVAYPQLVSDPPPVGSRAVLPVPLARLIDACLRRDPGVRPTLTEVGNALRGWLAPDGTPAVSG